MARPYRFRAPERTPARNKSLAAQCSCQRGPSDFGSYPPRAVPPARPSNASLRDGTGIIQCVVSKKDVPEAAFAAAEQAPQEAAIEVRGAVAKDPRSPIGFEVHVKDFRLRQGQPGYPIQPKEHGVGFLQEQRHL